jgi:drug/metabolite transporter (DMT)-like permease
MHLLPANWRGPAWMVAATGSYVVNDTMMKLATAGLPPLEVLALRGIGATIWCLPVVILMGYGRDIPKVFNGWVVLRNLLELCAVIGFIIALAKMPIADITVLGQVAPLIFIIGLSFILREKVGGVKTALIGLGFIGALMVAQPTMEGISLYALLGFSNAVFSAARDLVGRKVPADVPSWIVAFGVILVVMIGAAVVSVFTERWVVPEWHHMGLLLAAGLFLMFGHFCLFTAYRATDAASVAPFYYMFTVWSVTSGLVVFGQLPNGLAAAGMLLILLSGVTIVLLDGRKRRLSIAT